MIYLLLFYIFIIKTSIFSSGGKEAERGAKRVGKQELKFVRLAIRQAILETRRRQQTRRSDKRRYAKFGVSGAMRSLYENVVTRRGNDGAMSGRGSPAIRRGVLGGSCARSRDHGHEGEGRETLARQTRCGWNGDRACEWRLETRREDAGLSRSVVEERAHYMYRDTPINQFCRIYFQDVYLRDLLIIRLP